MARRKKAAAPVAAEPTGASIDNFNTKIADKFGFKVLVNNKKEIRLSGTLEGSIGLVNSGADSFLNARNKERFVELITDDRSSFTGSSVRDFKKMLKEGPDMVEYENMLKHDSIAQSVLKTMVLDDFDKPRRVRVRHEYDGEYNLEREGELCCFDAIRKIAAKQKAIELKCHFAAPGWTNAVDITQFGCVIWAILQKLEQSGVMARVHYVKHNRGSMHDFDGDVITEILVKDFGNYITPHMLATVLSGPFYRRVGLATICMAAETKGHVVDGGLGSPQAPAGFQYEDGVVHLAMGALGENTGRKLKDILTNGGTL